MRSERGNCLEFCGGGARLAEPGRRGFARLARTVHADPCSMHEQHVLFSRYTKWETSFIKHCARPAVVILSGIYCIDEADTIITEDTVFYGGKECRYTQILLYAH